MLTGMDLKVERVKARVTAQRLAAALDVSRQRVSAIEALAVVNADLSDRYLAALLSLTIRTEVEQAQAS